MVDKMDNSICVNFKALFKNVSKTFHFPILSIFNHGQSKSALLYVTCGENEVVYTKKSSVFREDKHIRAIEKRNKYQ